MLLNVKLNTYKRNSCRYCLDSSVLASLHETNLPKHIFNYTVWSSVTRGARGNYMYLHACMSTLIRERLISLHFLLHNQHGDVERPGKYIAHSCATLKINQNWPLHDDVIEIYQRHI